MDTEFTADTENTVKSNLDLGFGNNFLSSFSEHYPLALKVRILKVTTSSNEKLFFLSGAKNEYFSSIYAHFILKRRYSQLRNVTF